MPKISIILCSYKRPESLKRCLYSIKNQDYDDYEIILCEEEGHLVELKEKSRRKAKGEILVFIDDDVICHYGWLKSIVEWFSKCPKIIGLTGPTYVSDKYRKNRDVFKGGLFKCFYNWFFLEGKAYLPGRITSCGVNTLGANYQTEFSQQVQKVDFLEPAQYAIRREVIEKVDGFDIGYSGVAEWAEIDLFYRIKQYGKLLYVPSISVSHCPEKGDIVYNKRLDTVSRYNNYCRFADKFIKPSFKNKLYRFFLKTYFFMKEVRWI